MLPLVAHAGDSGAPAQASEVRSWLLRIHEAASHRNFQGTFVVSGGGSVSSARIAHYCEGKNQFERSESLDGQPRHVYRHNDVVHTVWPGSRVAMIEQRDLISSFPALLQAGDDKIAEFYEVRSLASDRVAGHDANVLLVKPKDMYRYGYRLWADRSSGLLLRADVLGERGDVLETSAFSEVSIDVRPQPESVLQPMKKLDGYRIVRPALTPTTLETEGWAMRVGVPGFRQVSCVNRPIDGTLPDDRDPAAPARQGARSPVLQAIYSDGLTYVSVFIEPFDPQRHTRPMSTAVGPTQTLMQQLGDSWVTVIGDVPPATLRQFAKGLERKK
ncbi:MAG TPA: MucB/RseB C-terminal domain-containing protein [Burkholderiaceae bacterium]|nr:MucB/RseB C-terminal domain-containing protein [Burkholderiaceae bacterium]